MASLTDLFNPTFLMFLGILVLVVALLVVYFETKFREQNHKISSMLSLVSSLAEEVNGSKMFIHQLTMNRQPPNPQFFQQQQQPDLEKRIVQNDNLILVSDDEEDSDADDSDSDAASEVSIDESVDDDDDDDSDNSVIELGEHSNDVKVLKLNISDNNESDVDEASLDEMDDLSVASLEEMDDLDDSSTSSVSIKEEKNDNIKSMDLKSINITLEETKPEQPLDYRKMALPKLRSIVAEKGLSSDSSKLKKNELLKLLGVE
jgi:hypothetical protein